MGFFCPLLLFSFVFLPPLLICEGLPFFLAFVFSFFFFFFLEERRQTCCIFFFFLYLPGREERCWEGLQCEICSSRVRAEAAYEWVSVFRRCYMFLRTFYMNGVWLCAFCYQGDKDASLLLVLRRRLGFFLLSFSLFHWLIRLRNTSFILCFFEYHSCSSTWTNCWVF